MEVKLLNYGRLESAGGVRLIPAYDEKAVSKAMMRHLNHDARQGRLEAIAKYDPNNPSVLLLGPDASKLVEQLSKYAPTSERNKGKVPIAIETYNAVVAGPKK